MGDEGSGTSKFWPRIAAPAEASLEAPLGDLIEDLDPYDFTLMLVVEFLGLLEPLRTVVLPADLCG